jgi:hypothetical protein|tara:strand:+ start:2855 stop:3310 length:456 start_codon:yes stop_codon:yes gene_type:complete
MINELKIACYNHCIKLVNTKIDVSKTRVDSAQESASGETKSTAGDKHETARAMAMLEKDKASQLLQTNLMQLKLLDQINPKKLNTSPELGALIMAENCYFYLSIGLGKCVINNQEVYVISPASRVGSVLIGLKANDTFLFNKLKLTVITIC